VHNKILEKRRSQSKTQKPTQVEKRSSLPKRFIRANYW